MPSIFHIILYSYTLTIIQLIILNGIALFLLFTYASLIGFQTPLDLYKSIYEVFLKYRNVYEYFYDAFTSYCIILLKAFDSLGKAW